MTNTQTQTTTAQQATDLEIDQGSGMGTLVLPKDEDKLDEEVEILGYATVITTGDILVERDWLLNRMDELGIPDKFKPTYIWPSSAYNRTMARLVEGMENVEVDDREFHVRMEEGAGKIRHVYAVEVLSEDESGEEGGSVEKHDLLTFDYDKDSQSMRVNRKVEDGDFVEPIFRKVLGRANGLYQKMATHHDDSDIRSITYELTRDDPESISLRNGGAVYFIPARNARVLRAMSTLWNEMDNQWKDGGRKAEITPIPVINTPDMRETIRTKVEEQLGDMIDKVVENAFRKLSEDEDAVAKDIISDVEERLGDAYQMEGTYNDLLDIRLSVKKRLRENRKQLKDEEDKKEILDAILAQTSLDDLTESEDDGDDN